MQRSETRILTTHTGSLPRPPALLRLYQRRNRGEAVDAGEIDTLARAAVRDVLHQQRAAGLDVANNGEQARDSFHLYIRERLSGLGGSWQRPPRTDVERYPVFKDFRRRMQEAFPSAINDSALPTAVGEVHYLQRDAIEHECDDFRAALEETGDGFADHFLTAPSPGIVATTIQNRHYDSERAYLAALGQALQVEYEAIVNHGFVLQLDCPDLALERHLYFGDKPLSAFLEFVENVVSALNNALVNIPRERVRMHVCWGNSESPHDSDVPLEEVLPIIQCTKVGAFVLPFANPRHAHEFRCFERFPLADDQCLIAGVVDTLTNVVEHPEVVADRIQRVAQVLGGPTRLLAGTDCGFDTAAGLGRVASDVVWAKLGSLAEGARLASQRMF
jgi:5-methyltetrahydropteroyltriglutamate--homocysteine methyltransferase